VVTTKEVATAVYKFPNEVIGYIVENVELKGPRSKKITSCLLLIIFLPNAMNPT